MAVGKVQQRRQREGSCSAAAAAAAAAAGPRLAAAAHEEACGHEPLHAHGPPCVDARGADAHLPRGKGGLLLLREGVRREGEPAGAVSCLPRGPDGRPGPALLACAPSIPPLSTYTHTHTSPRN